MQEYVTYAESCAKSEAARQKQELNHKSASPAPARKAKRQASDEIDLSQGYETIELGADDDDTQLLV